MAGTGEARGAEWKLQKGKGASGKGLMRAMPDKGSQAGTGYETQSPRLDYLVNFPTAGKYKVWMRTAGPHPGSDSLFLSLDLVGDGRSLYHSGNGKIHWGKHKGDWSLDVKTPGMHTVNIWMREDGDAVDKIIITRDRGLKAPKGNGPKESRVK